MKKENKFKLHGRNYSLNRNRKRSLSCKNYFKEIQTEWCTRIVRIYAVVTRKATAICITNHDTNDITKYIHMANHKAWQPLYPANNNVSYKYSDVYVDGEVHQLQQIHLGVPTRSFSLFFFMS